MTHSYLYRQGKALFILGLWTPPKKCTRLYKFYTITDTISQYMFLICNLLYMGMVWGDLEQVTEASYLIFTQATTCIKITSFLYNRDKFLRLLAFMEEEVFASQSPAHDKILAAVVRRMSMIYVFFMSCSLCNCSQWALAPVFEKGDSKIFPFSVWMPIDPATASMPEYMLGYIWQMVTIYLSAASYLTLDFLTTGLIMFVSAQLEIAVTKLQEIQHVPPLSDLDHKQRIDLIKQNNNVLIDCIRRHQAILRFIDSVEDIFNMNIFVQLGSTVIIICIICFRMTIEPPNTPHFYSTVTYLWLMLAQLYLYCWCGSVVTEQSQVLSDALYKTAWYEQDIKFNRNLWIAMEFMKKPLILRAGYYIPLSRPTFVSILRCSYSYFAVLNQANE